MNIDRIIVDAGGRMAEIDEAGQPSEMDQEWLQCLDILRWVDPRADAYMVRLVLIEDAMVAVKAQELTDGLFCTQGEF